MKKSILFLSLVSFSLFSFAGVNGDDIYKKLKAENEESFSMSLSKNMIDFFDMDLDFNGKEKLITGDFHEGKMLVLNDVNSIKKIKNLFEDENYEMVESDEKEQKEDNNEAYLYISRKGKNVAEAHFVLVGEDAVTILSVYGDIKVKNK